MNAEKFISIHPDDSVSYIEMAHVYSAQNQKENAEKFYEKAISVSKDSWCLMESGRFYFSCQKWEKVIELIEELLKNESTWKYVAPINELALSYYQTGKVEAGLKVRSEKKKG